MSNSCFGSCGITSQSSNRVPSIVHDIPTGARLHICLAPFGAQRRLSAAMPKIMAYEMIDTNRKALQINLDARRYGTFAEIGAGQEVARWFFHAGGAAGTVAKTISAYDMAVSDAIYGPTDRYVSRRRLRAMLDNEYELLLERLEQSRGAKTAFFVFANTVATRPAEGDGWLGIRFQAEPGADPSDIIIHVRMLDRQTRDQQEALGVIGVNLIHGSFYLHRQPEALIRALLDNLTWDRVEVDMIRFAGPAFGRLDNRLLALQLVKQGLTEAAMFTATGEAVQWAEVLYKKPVLVQRGSFHPLTTATLDVLERGLEQFAQDPQLNGQPPVVLMEMTLRHLTTGNQNRREGFPAPRRHPRRPGQDRAGLQFPPVPPPEVLSLPLHEPPHRPGPGRLQAQRDLQRDVLQRKRRRPARRPGPTLQEPGAPLCLSQPRPRIRARHHRREFPGRPPPGPSPCLSAGKRLHPVHPQLPARPPADSFSGRARPHRSGDPSWEPLVPQPIVEIIKRHGLFGHPTGQANP